MKPEGKIKNQSKGKFGEKKNKKNKVAGQFNNNMNDFKAHLRHYLMGERGNIPLLPYCFNIRAKKWHCVGMAELFPALDLGFYCPIKGENNSNRPATFMPVLFPDPVKDRFENKTLFVVVIFPLISYF